MSDLINPNSIIPMYRQILNILNDKITSKELKPGDKLPSEAALIKEYGVSRITIRAAITELVEKGILARSQGKGTFVATPKSSYKANDLVGFSRSCLLAGKPPSTKVLSVEMVDPTPKYMEFFGIKGTDKIVCTRRLRYVDGIPTMIEINHYPSGFSFLLEENLEGSLFELLQNKYGIEVVNDLRSLEICYPTKDEMTLLNLKKSTPLLLFRDTQKGASRNPLFLSKQLYNTEHLKFYF